MEQIDWSKAPEGATHYTPKIEDCEGYRAVFWRMEGGTGVEAWAVNQDGSLEYYSRPTWLISNTARLVERPTAWTGEGLPPVGAVCEAWHMGSEQGVVEVRYSGECMVLWNVRLKHEQCSASENYTFKAIRTPEQIAAQERELAIKDMAWLTNWPAAASTISICASLYDAGLRFTEPKR